MYSGLALVIVNVRSIKPGAGTLPKSVWSTVSGEASPSRIGMPLPEIVMSGVSTGSGSGSSSSSSSVTVTSSHCPFAKWSITPTCPDPSKTWILDNDGMTVSFTLTVVLLSCPRSIVNVTQLASATGGGVNVPVAIRAGFPPFARQS